MADARDCQPPTDKSKETPEGADSESSSPGESEASSPPKIATGLTAVELAEHLLKRIEEGNAYARRRKREFMRRSSVLRGSIVLLSASSTIILGLQNLDFWAGLGFSFVALVTVASALEPFFAWRFRWVLMEEAQYEFYRVEDDLKFLLASSQRETLDKDDVDQLYSQYKEIWAKMSGQWMEHRRLAGTGT